MNPKEIIQSHLDAMRKLVESGKLNKEQKTVMGAFLDQITPKTDEQWAYFEKLVTEHPDDFPRAMDEYHFYNARRLTDEELKAAERLTGK